jgi:hypothetical protein
MDVVLQFGMHVEVVAPFGDFIGAVGQAIDYGH